MIMPSKIVSLHGAPIDGAGPEPDQLVVELLEDLLARAKTGEVQGLAAAYIVFGGTTASSWEASGGSTHTLGFAISTLQHRYYAGLQVCDHE